MSFLLQLAIPELVLRWSDETPIKPGFKKSHVGSTGKGPFGGLRTSVFSVFAISSSARESGVLPAPTIQGEAPLGPCSQVTGAAVTQTGAWEGQGLL